MLIGLVIAFVTWAIYVVVQIIVVHSSSDKTLSPKKLLQRLGIALLAGLIWGGILKYVVTGSPH